MALAKRKMLGNIKFVGESERGGGNGSRLWPVTSDESMSGGVVPGFVCVLLSSIFLSSIVLDKVADEALLHM